MEEFSGIRATRRPKRGDVRRLAGFVLFMLAVATGGRSVPAADHGAPAEHGAPAATPAPVPPPPPPSNAHRPPPPVLDGPPAAAEPRPRPRWLADPTTGRALGGYDPVAYFLNGRPTPGDPDHQIDWGGVTWLFQDEGTEAAFRDAPETYAPLFAGRCAFAVSQGRPAEGSPRYFVVFRGRLLLFADATARAAFLLAPDRVLAEAERRWPALLADLP